MTDNATRTLDSLLAHRSFVRAMATSLVYDRSQVDDVEQETWLAAMQRPPQGPPRPWLARVVRGHAARRHRAESRIRARQRKGARDETVASTSELASRAEVGQLVAQAVLALPDPYRETLLLRFYDDAPPRDIAARMQVPVETVRTRVKRGLDRIRVSLDEKQGDRSTWVTALTPLAAVPRGLTQGTLASGALAVKTSTKLAVVAALLLACAGIAILIAQGQDSDPSGGNVEARNDSTPPTPGALETGNLGREDLEPGDGTPPSSSTGDTRVADAEAPVTGASSPAQFAAVFDDGNGNVLPPDQVIERLGGRRVAAQLIPAERFRSKDPFAARLDERPWVQDVTVSIHGSHLAIDPTPPEGSWVLLVPRAQSTPYITDPFVSSESEPGALRIALPPPRPLVSLRFVDIDDQTPLARARVTPHLEWGDGTIFFPGTSRTCDGGGRVELPIHPEARTSFRGRGPWWWIESDTHLRLLSSFEIARLAAEGGTHDILATRKGSVRGRAFTSAGRPANQLEVAVMKKGRTWVTRTDECGAFTLEGLPPTRLMFHLFEDRATLRVQTTDISVNPGQETIATIGKAMSADESSSISIHIRAGAEPLRRLLASIKPWNGEGKGRMAQSDASGTLRWDGMSDGAYEVRVALGNPRLVDDFRLWTKPEEPIRVVAGEASKRTVELPSGQLRVLIVDSETKRPIANAVCLARSVDQGMKYDIPGFNASLGWSELTDSKGHVTLRALPNTLLQVVAIGGSYVRYEQTLQPQSEGADRIVIELTKK